MKHKLCLVALAVMFSAMVLTSCCGRSKETKVITESTKTTTTGQELQDLKKAHDEGVINDKEYEKTKKKILKSP